MSSSDFWSEEAPEDTVPAAPHLFAAMTEAQRDVLYKKLHPIEDAASRDHRYYVPLYVGLHQEVRWCGNPACYRPVSKEAMCPTCKTLFCGQKCRELIHSGKNRPQNSDQPACHCGRVDQTEALRNYLTNMFIRPQNPDDLERRAVNPRHVVPFMEYRLIQVLEEWLMLALVHGSDYRLLSILPKDALIPALQRNEAFKFLDATGLDINEHGIKQLPQKDNGTRVFQCAQENILPDLAGLVVLLLLPIDFLFNGAARSQVLMTAAAMVHASRVEAPWHNDAYVGISQTPDAIRPDFITGETLASPLAIYQADQKLGWPVCYYCIMLVPLGIKDNATRRAMQFCVGLYVTPKDAIVIGSAGTSEAGYGIISLLRAHASTANPCINRKAPGSEKHLDRNATERWLKRLNDLTAPEAESVNSETGSTPAHREGIIRDALAIGRKIKYPVAFPRYRLVTCRVIVNIV